MIGSYAMKEMPSTKEMINQINLDKDVTIQQYKILSVPNNWYDMGNEEWKQSSW